MMRAICFPAARAIIICVIGAIRPPLMPWRMRNAINEFADQARPHKAEESVKAEEAPEVEGFGSNALHQPAVEREHKSECQKIAAGDPLNRREAAVQIHGETGERYVDDGRIELREKRAEHRDGRDLPDQWVEPAGFAGGLRQGRPGPHRWCERGSDAGRYFQRRSDGVRRFGLEQASSTSTKAKPRPVP